MSRDFDINQQLQSDVETVKRLNRTGAGDLSPGVIIEYALWTLAVCSVIAMMVTLPWVGPTKAIPGSVWLGYSLACILLFGGLAGAVRLVRETGDDLDDGMSRRFETHRGR